MVSDADPGSESVPAPPRGRLRILLGIAPGAGKTYRMLSEAHQRVTHGTDVVVGIVDADAPARTLAMLAGLEIVPPRRLEHRDLVVEELDTAAVADRRPGVVLIDDLGHRNAPGSEHQFRWQQVEDLRDLGIHVIATADIGQMDPVAEAAETITGGPILDRVPRQVVDTANEIELVDVGAADLRDRVARGEIYPPSRAASVLDAFYSEATLVALRELALRFLTRRLDEQLERGLTRGSGKSWISHRERILVVVDDRTATRQTVRRAAQLAGAAHATLAAVVIETPADDARSRAAADRLVDNTRYAADLGAEVVRYRAPGLVSGLEHVARSRRITHLFITHRRRAGLLRWARSSLPEVLAERLPEMEIHIVTGSGATPAVAGQP